MKTFARRLYCIAATLALAICQWKIVVAVTPFLWSSDTDRQSIGLLIVTIYSFLVGYGFSQVMSLWSGARRP